jgi:DNA-binding NtrC family response regulator
MNVPALRNRKEDIPLLTEKFMTEFHGENAMDQVAEFDRTMESFMNHDWPGNVRELRNLVEIASYSDRRPIDLGAFLYFGKMKAQSETARQTHTADRPFKMAKNDLISRFEKDYIRDILRRHNGNISRASQEAGIERAYLQRLIKKYSLK